MELRSKALLRRHAPLPHPLRPRTVSYTDKVGIARALLQLQRQGKLIVWVDAEQVRIAPFGEADPVKRRLTWEQAAKIADAPDKFLWDGLYVPETKPCEERGQHLDHAEKL